MMTDYEIIKWHRIELSKRQEEINFLNSTIKQIQYINKRDEDKLQKRINELEALNPDEMGLDD